MPFVAETGLFVSACYSPKNLYEGIVYILKQKEAAQVIKEKANAELQLLKAQVHQHFLFNSLNLPAF